MNPETRSDLLTWLAANVPETRIRHILRVEQMSIDLARHHGIDPDLAAQAGLMHDLAKYFKSDRLLTMAENAGLILNDIEQQVPHLIHADVSAIVAREEFGITHEGILNAIANHTLGKPGMDPLSCIVFLADSLEPGRGKTDELNELRALSLENLKIAVWRTADYSLQYLLKSQQLIHPRTVLTRNWFLQEVSSHT
jgi:predicted HD superfamily hydrolase involved in NAD metabolism